MTSTGARIERRNWAQQEKPFADRDFVAGRVAPQVPELAQGWNPADWKVDIVRSKSTERITLRYTFGRIATIYGKAYFDKWLGRAAHSSLAYLWQQGFAAGSGLEVPEPLGFIEEANLLIMRAAKGMPLDQFASASSLEEALAATRAAARWLLKFQSTEIPGLRVQSDCERTEIFNIAEALAKVAAACPDCSPLLIAMVHDLHAIAPKDYSPWRMAPLNGQFRPAHVFIDGGDATVIDIEEICLSDPAKDVARYVHVIKKTCFEESGNAHRADELAEAFISEFRRTAPSALENLAYFRALLSLKAFAKILKSRKVGEEERKTIGEMYRREFEEATHGGAGETAAA